MKKRYYHFVSRAFGHTGVITICATNLGDAVDIMEKNIPAFFAGAFGCLGEVMWLTPQAPEEHSKPIFATFLPGWADHAAYEIRA